MNQMEIFKNPEFGSIRTFEQDDKVYPRPRVVRAAGGPHRQVWPYAATLPEGTPARPLQQLDFGRKAVPAPVGD